MKKIISFIIVFIFVSTFSFAQSQEEIDDLLKTLDKQAQDFESLASNSKKINKPETYNIYLDDDIKEPSNYRNTLELISGARDIDTLIFKINTNGGSVQTTIALVNAIKNCKGTTIAEIQTAYSAGGIIAMACKKQVVMPYATMMIHSIQLGGVGGDINNIQVELTCLRKLNNDIITASFKKFLTKKEIEYVLNGGIIWLNEGEIKSRLTK